MATQKQIAANRRNAEKSTGPRTPEGKAASRMNALKTGIDAESLLVRGEDPNALEALTAEYYGYYQPVTPQERCLVDSLVRAEWLQRRLTRVETQLWNRRLDLYPGETAPLADAYAGMSETMSRLQRRIDSAGRSYRATLREAERLRNNRPSAPQPTAPPQPVDAPTPSPEIGFVPQNSPSPGGLRVAAPPRPGLSPLPSAPQSPSAPALPPSIPDPHVL